MREVYAVILSAGLALAASAADAPRVAALGGDVTEIVFALGAGAQVVGVDLSSTHPAAVKTLPNLGYVRALNAEGVLALGPTLVLASHDAGPPEALEQLRRARVEVVMLPEAHDAAGVAVKLRKVAAALGRVAEGERLVADLEARFASLAASIAGDRAKGVAAPRVLFMLTTGPGSPLVAGAETRAAGIIALAGGASVGTGFTGYKPVAGEALVALAPETIVLMADRFEAAGGIEGVLKIPGVAQTPAGKARRIHGMDGGWLLNFGPRAPDAAAALHQLLRAK